ncbi:MAG TPA: spore protease YyaC [Firmicutes bacterium]|nr:spore protease YyaC [Bacillota bacterium]
MQDPEAPAVVERALRHYLSCDLAIQPSRSPVVMCIGTDRSTGDSLGPLVGSTLVELGIPGDLVLGTLDEPVHAANLSDAIRRVTVTYPRPYVIAVDACLGRLESVGAIVISKGPVKPGTGVNKDLPAVGDLHITGIVNVGGYMEYLVLQNTRLSLVFRMAKTIACGLVPALLGVIEKPYGQGHR